MRTRDSEIARQRIPITIPGTRRLRESSQEIYFLAMRMRYRSRLNGWNLLRIQVGQYDTDCQLCSGVRNNGRATATRVVSGLFEV